MHPPTPIARLRLNISRSRSCSASENGIVQPLLIPNDLHRVVVFGDGLWVFERQTQSFLVPGLCREPKRKRLSFQPFLSHWHELKLARTELAQITEGLLRL